MPGVPVPGGDGVTGVVGGDETDAPPDPAEPLPAEPTGVSSARSVLMKSPSTIAAAPNRDFMICSPKVTG